MIIEEKRISKRWVRGFRMLAYRVFTSPIFVSRDANALMPGASELFFRRFLDENSHMIQLSDGGHFENLGLYELIRRRLKIIIVCDGAADKHFAFDDLANAIEKVRADFGALININSSDLKALTPASTSSSTEGSMRYAKRGYLVADITYAPGKEGENKKGVLIFLTTTFFKRLSADLYAYRKAHEQFPDQPTGDQFFDEKQFEAYRELGFQTAWEMLQDKDILSRVSQTLGKPEIKPHDSKQGKRGSLWSFLTEA